MLVETRGCLDLAALHDDSVELRGWAAPLEPLAFDGFVVEAGEQRLAGPRVRYPIPSADVAQVFGDLYGAERSRFAIEVPFEDGRAPRDCLVGVTPRVRVGGEIREGCTLYNLLEPRVALPSEDLVNAVGGGFMVGFEYLSHFVQRAGLRREHDVLDVGCGIGRMAYPLAYYLRSTARYEGFDVVKSSIDWANYSLGRQFPNFGFRQVDIWNQWFNPGGTIRSDEFVFPYGDAEFDFVFLASVFTHMYAPDVRRYLREIARVARPGGRVFASCFLLDDEARTLVSEGRGTQAFVHRLDEAWTTDPVVPERAIAFEEATFAQWCHDAGFTILDRYPGSWCGRPRWLSYQDLFVLERT